MLYGYQMPTGLAPIPRSPPSAATRAALVRRLMLSGSSGLRRSRACECCRTARGRSPWRRCRRARATRAARRRRRTTTCCCTATRAACTSTRPATAWRTRLTGAPGCATSAKRVRPDWVASHGKSTSSEGTPQSTISAHAWHAPCFSWGVSNMFYAEAGIIPRHGDADSSCLGAQGCDGRRCASSVRSSEAP